MTSELSTNERVVYRCKTCKTALEAYLDHVGRCDVEGQCPGTFKHPGVFSKGLGDCYSPTKLRHADVIVERVRIQPRAAI